VDPLSDVTGFLPMHHDEWDDDEWHEDEDDDGLDPCPYCGRNIFGDSVQCPHCGTYLSREDAPYERKPWWIIVGVIACLYAVYRWTF